MLQITIPSTELYDERTNEIVYTKEQTLQLEHSLVSLSKWESKWCKPFLSDREKTDDETLDYIKCMTLTQNVNPNIYKCLTAENIEAVKDYINAPMTAMVFYDDQSNTNSRKIITAERIYYWMFTLGIPFECRKWHLNRLLALIRFCSNENQPNKKLSQNELVERNRALNEERKKKFNSKG